MLASMTGFGNDVYSDDRITLETEIKSLNSRYLDLSIRLPKELSQHEYVIRELVKKSLIRGKISVNINLINNELQFEDSSLNEEALVKTINLLDKLKSAADIKRDISLNQLLVLRENYLNESDSQYSLDLDLLKNSISNALKSLNEMRKKEGSHLKIDIDDRIRIIEETLTKIEKISKNSTQEYFNKFKDKAKKLYDEFIDDEERFLVELGILSEKHDVTEECIRLRSHISLFNQTLSKSVDVGRKLNFICQEMNREVNTINSKSISSEISHLGINIKEELEKIREQIQNIE